MTLDSVFRIASMTKPITSVAAMQLVEDGDLGLDVPVSKYIPSFAKLQVLEGFDETTGAPKLRPASKPVTLRHLLTHTSGFGYKFWNPLLREATTSGVIPNIPGKADSFLQAPLVFDPGERWEYGINTEWLGRLIETVRGESLDEVFAKSVFRPLGMSDTHFNVPEGKWPRLVSVHVRQANGGLKERRRPSPARVTFYNGGGGLYSTAADYTQFLRTLLRGGELDGNRILKPDTVALMGQNHIGGLEAGRMLTVMPEVSNDFDFFPGSVDHFGFGFLINSKPVEGGRAAGSLAWAGLDNTYFWVDPTRDTCGVLMTQVLPFYDAKVVELLGEFERAVYGRTNR